MQPHAGHDERSPHLKDKVGMSLFQSLRALYRPDRFMLEDFHTEIVARVLQNSPKLAFTWLQSIGATTLDETKAKITVRPQQAFPALADHDRASRVDLTIRLRSKDRSEVIFIESKVGSDEGPKQLQHYADHLSLVCEDEDVTQGRLVYVTRDFEAVRKPQFGNSVKCCFVEPTRWFRFYQQLSLHSRGDALSDELRSFMKENNMSLGNRFRPADLIAMQNLVHVKSLMDETLEACRQQLERVVGVRTHVRSRKMRELQDHSRYALLAVIGSRWDMACLVGYWFSGENDAESPWVGVCLQSNPESPRRDEIRKALRSMAAPSWNTSQPQDHDQWWDVYRGMPLVELLGQEDHLHAIKKLFEEALNDVAEFRKMHPGLPWGAESRSDDTQTGEE